MEQTTVNENEVKKWLSVAMVQENVENLCVKICGGSERGDGYLGDVIFADVTGTDNQGKNKKYNLVLKCSKSSAALIEQLPACIKAFVRENYLYQNVLPFFKKFQLSKGIEKPFDCVPKFYGAYSDEFRHVIVLENLKKIGYDMWPKGKPLTREVINIVLEEYAKFHATSVALKEQDYERHQKLVEDLNEDVFKEFFKSSDFIITPYKSAIEEVYELLKDDVKSDILEKWLKLKEQVPFIFVDMAADEEDLQVLSHGDCWLNNFMFKFENEDRTDISNVAILDWQISTFKSPVIDLSYFLFTSISKEDVLEMDTILKNYYNHFRKYLTKMGSNFANKYTLEKFFEEWKKYSKFGVLICILPIKSFHSEKEELPDMAETADSGVDISECFEFTTRDLNGYKNRIKPIVEYAVENDLF